ncbi:MAG: acyltransferase family protein [Rickettsiales bacterium]
MTSHDHQLDNLKFILILLVVFGHMLEAALPVSPTLKTLYATLYVFHVPALVFLTGITSKQRLTAWHALGLLLILAVFQTTYVLQFAAPDFPFFTTPYWIMWFILSLLCWRLTLPLFHRIPYPCTAAFLIAFMSGFIPSIGTEFGMSRTLVFLPFFTLGHFHGRKILDWCKAPLPRWLPPLTILLALITTFTTALLLGDIKWLYGSASYATLTAAPLHALAARTLHYLSAASGILALLFLVTPEQRKWSKRGARILTIYLFHGFFVPALGMLMAVLSHHGAWAALLFALSATAWLGYVLSIDSPLNSAVNWLYRPKKLWKKLRRT